MGYLYNTTFANNKPNFKRLPVAEIQQYNAEMDNRYKTNQQMYDKMELAISNMPIDATDTPIMKNALDRGELEMATPMLRKASKDLAMDKNVQGALQSHSMGINYAKKLDELKTMHYKNGKGITPDQYAMHTFKTNKINEGKNPVEYDPITGTYKNMFQGSTPAAFYDVESEARKIANALKADGYSTGLQASSVLSKLKVTDFKSVSADKIYGAVVSMLQNNDRASAYLNDISQSKMFMMTYANNGEEVKLDEDGKLIPNISEQNLINEGIDIEAKDKNGNLVYKNLYNDDNTINQTEAGKLIYGDNVNDIAKGATTFAWNTSSSKYYRDDVYMAKFNATLRDNASKLKKKQDDLKTFYTGETTAINLKVTDPKKVIKTFNALDSLIEDYTELRDTAPNLVTKRKYDRQLGIYKTQKSKLEDLINDAKVSVYEEEYGTTDENVIIGSFFTNKDNIEFYGIKKAKVNDVVGKRITPFIEGVTPAYEERNTASIPRKRSTTSNDEVVMTRTTFEYVVQTPNGSKYVISQRCKRAYLDHMSDITNGTTKGMKKYFKANVKEIAINPPVSEISSDASKRINLQYKNNRLNWTVMDTKGTIIDKHRRIPTEATFSGITTEQVDGKNFYFSAVDEKGTHYYIAPPTGNMANIIAQEYIDRADVSTKEGREQYAIGMNMKFNQDFISINSLRENGSVKIYDNKDNKSGNSSDLHLADVRLVGNVGVTPTLTVTIAPEVQAIINENIELTNEYLISIGAEPINGEMDDSETVNSEAEARQEVDIYRNLYRHIKNVTH